MEKAALEALTQRIKNSEDNAFIVNDHYNAKDKAAAGHFGPLSTLMKQYQLSIVEPLKPL